MVLSILLVENIQTDETFSMYSLVTERAEKKWL